MRKLLAAIAIVAFVAVASAQEPQPSRDTFSITGYVLDTDGHLVPGAEVHAMPVDKGGLVMSSVTQVGQFSISLDGPGTYRVFASTKEKGYRQIGEPLFMLDPEGIPEVIVSSRSPKQSTIVRLRSGAANLVVRFTDSETGRPIQQAELIIYRDDNAKNRFVRPLISFDREATIRLMLPTLPLRIEASAPGYKVWSYHDTTDVLFLAPKESKEINIRLERIKK